MASVTEHSAKVDLAHEPDFRLGEVSVCPSVCRVGTVGREARIEPRVMEVLVVLVRATNRIVTREELIEACWGGRFVSDDAVARVIAAVRNLARSFEPAPFVVETVPKVGFRLITPGDTAVGPEGDAAAISIAPRLRWVRLAAAVTAMAVLLVGGWAAWRMDGRSDRPAAQNGRVEVMLFEPLRPDPALQRFSISVSDAAARMLAGSGIETAQRLVRRDTGGAPGGAELRVAGTVDHDGDKYVINAQVLDRRSGDVLWSGRYARDAGAAVGYPEAAANQIVDTLHCALTRRATSRRPLASATFRLLLNACEFRRTADQQALESIRRLVQAAPDLSAAHSMYAVTTAMLASEGPSASRQAYKQASRDAAARALKLDPKNGEAYLARATVDWDKGPSAEQEQDFLRAVALSPNLSRVRNRYVGFLRGVGRTREALETSQRAVAADPFSPTQLSMLGLMLATAGDLEQATALRERADLIDPSAGEDMRVQIAFWRDDPEAARAKIRGTTHFTPRELACLDTYLARLARVGAAGAQGLPAGCETMRLDWRLRMLSRQGDADGAYAALAREAPNFSPTSALFYPEMKGFRQDPRFMPFAKRLGLVDYWTRSGHWPDFCAEPDLPYDCRTVAKALT